MTDSVTATTTPGGVRPEPAIVDDTDQMTPHWFDAVLGTAGTAAAVRSVVTEPVGTGQMAATVRAHLDLAAEGRFDGQHSALDEKSILTLQAMKTGALLRFACVAGAILGRASPAQRAALSRYGEALGAAFQIADDLLDVEGDAATIGKATQKDAASGKATLVGILGVTAARQRLTELVAQAHVALAIFGENAAILRETARFVADRPK